MKVIVVMLLICISVVNLRAQVIEGKEPIEEVVFDAPAEEVFIRPIDVADSNAIYAVVEQSPEYPGGYTAMMEYIAKTLRYPKKSLREGIEGTVFVQYIVEKDGTLSNFQVIRGISQELDEEVLRIVRAMPKWKPGKQNGKATRCKFVLPMKYKLPEISKREKQIRPHRIN